MMRVGVLSVLATLVLTGCPDKKLRESISYYDKGTQAFEKNALGDAESQFKNAIVKKKNNHAAQYGLGLVFAQRAQANKDEGSRQMQLREAADYFNTAAGLKDSEPMYHLWLGQVQYELGQVENAKASLQKAIDLNDKLYRAHYYLGKAKLQAGDAKGGAAAINKSIELNPAYGQALVDLAQLYIAWDYLDEAIQLLDGNAKNLRSAQARKNAFYNLGFAYQLSKQYKKAEAAFSDALKVDKSFTIAQLKRGVMRSIQGDKDGAIADLDAVMKAKLEPYQRAQALKYRYR